MKTIKFRNYLIPLVLNNSKTVTWRMFDNKNLTKGDRLVFKDYSTEIEFAEAVVQKIELKSLGAMEEIDFKNGHERYRSKPEMLKEYRSYYGSKVTLDTPVKIVHFKVNKFYGLPKILEHFKKVDPKIYKVIKKVNYDEWFKDRARIGDKLGYFEALCRIVVGQQVSGKAARSIFEKFKNLFPNKPITPKNILKMKHEKLRSVGLSNAKAKYIRNLAEATERGELHLDKLDKMPDEEVLKEIVKIKGFGPWSAEMFLMFTLRRTNVFSHGDLGLKKGIMKVYGLKKMPDQNKMEKITKKWEPYKTYGAIGLWESL